MKRGMSFLLSALVTVGACFAGVSCGGGGGGSSGPPPPPPPTITSVSLAPGSQSLLVRQNFQFTATVQGTGSFNPAVEWQVENTTGGNATVGTISSLGNYIAPASVPNPNPVTVRARSVADNSKFATAQVTVNPENVQITISPGSASVQLGLFQQFTATVTGSINTLVNWSLDGIPPVSSEFGFLDATGRYIAPNLLPVTNTVTVRATSAADPTKSAAATVTILSTAGGITVSINPQNQQAAFDGSQSIQFDATVTGTATTGVNWTASAGSITAGGLFNPGNLTSGFVPPDITIRATSVVNAGAQATSLVTVVAPAPSITSFSPAEAAAGDDLTIQGQGFYATSDYFTVFFPGPNGTTIPALANGFGSQIHGTVPQGATSGPLFVQMKFQNFATQQTPAATFTRLPLLRIRAERKELAQEETVQLQARLLGDETPRTIDWGTGISAAGVYTAPASVAADTFVRLTGCIHSTTQCDALIVRINPVRIDPIAPAVDMGGNLQLTALSTGGAVAPVWKLEAGGGSLSASGAYTAASLVEDSGGIPVTATFGGATQKASIAVTGGFPGLVNRVNDYLDFASPTPPTGTLPEQLAVAGNRAYSVARDTLPIFAVAKHYWIDVYDLTDPGHPIWIDAVEALSPGASFGPAATIFANGSFVFQVVDYPFLPVVGPANGIGVFSTINGHLSLTGFTTTPRLGGYDFNGGIGYAYASAPDGNLPGQWVNPATAYLFDGTTGSISQVTRSLPFPVPASTAELSGIAGAGNRLYLLLRQPAYDLTAPYRIAAYDVSANPALLLGSAAIQGGPIRVFGNLFFGGTEVFDISGPVPLKVGTLPVPGGIVDYNPSNSLGLTGSDAISVIDLSNPGAAKVKGILFDGAEPGRARWAGDFVLKTERMGGLGVFHGLPPGGAIPKPGLASGGTLGNVYDQVVSPPYLFIAADTDAGPFVTIYDITTNPPIRLGSYSETNHIPLSLRLIGSHLFVGTSQDLTVLNVASPSSPSKAGSVNLPTISTASSGNFLFAGTTDSHLVVLDVSIPATPVALKTLALPGGLPIIMRTAGTLLYVADEAAGLLIYDVSTPAAPVLLSQFQPSLAVLDVFIDGTLAFLAALDQGLVIVDVSVPSSPVLLSQVSLELLSCITPCSSSMPVYALSVAGHDNIVYVGSVNAAGRVFGFDYRTPAHPRLVSLASFGNALDQAMFTIGFYQSELFVGGYLFGSVLHHRDNSLPRNTIELYFPAFASGSGAAVAAPSSLSASPINFTKHPKL